MDNVKIPITVAYVPYYSGAIHWSKEDYIGTTNRFSLVLRLGAYNRNKF